MAQNRPKIGQQFRWGQVSFHSGVLSPEAAGRADTEEYRSGLSLCKNFIIGKTGALIKRPGFEYLGPTKYADKKSVAIPFDWGDVDGVPQTYVLEVGDEYMRVWKQGGTQVAEAIADGTDLIAGTFQWDPAGSGSNIYYLTDGGGDPGLEKPLAVYENADVDPQLLTYGIIYSLAPGQWAYGDADANGFPTIYVHLSDDADPDSKADGYLRACYPYEIALPYTEDDIEAIDYGQSADVLKLTHQLYAPIEISRTADDDWSYEEIEFGSAQFKPNLLDVIHNYSGSGYEYRYAVSAVTELGVESVIETSPWIDMGAEIGRWQGLTPYMVMAIETKNYQTTAKYPTTYWPRDDIVAYNIYRMSRGSEGRWPAEQWGWMRRIDAKGEFWDRGEEGIYSPDHVNSLNPFELDLTGSGQAYPLENDQLGVASRFEGWEGSGTCGAGYDFSWLLTEEAVFDVYGVGGDDFRLQLKGSGVDFDASGWTITTVGSLHIALPIRWTDRGGIDPDFGSVPTIIDRLPFNAAGDYPAHLAFYAERLFYTCTQNNPLGLWGSQPGQYTCFNQHAPLEDADAIFKSLPGRKISAIRSLVPQDSLLAGSSAGIVRIWAKDNVVTPRTLQARPQTEQGVSSLRPLMVGDIAIYAAESDAKVFATGYDLVRESYRQVDLSRRAEHLLRCQRVTAWEFIILLYGRVRAADRSILSWAYAEEPFSLISLAMSDGALLGITFVPEEELTAWCELEYDGLVKSVTTIREESTGCGTYAIVGQHDDGVLPYVEDESISYRAMARMSTRMNLNIANGIFLDCALHWEAVAELVPFVYTEDPLRITRNGHLLETDDIIVLDNFQALPGYESATNTDGLTVGWINGRRFKVVKIDANNFSLKDSCTDQDVNGAGWHLREYICGAYYQIPTDTFTGLEHLYGRIASTDLPGVSKNIYAVTNGFDPANGNEPWQVAVVANPAIDANGVVTMDYPATHATFGLGYTAEAATLDLQGGIGPDGLQGIPKYIGRVLVNVKDTIGLLVGSDADHVAALRSLAGGESGYPVAVPGALEGESTTPRTMINGIGVCDPPGGWARHGRVYIRHEAPVPATVLGIIPELSLGI